MAGGSHSPPRGCCTSAGTRLWWTRSSLNPELFVLKGNAAAGEVARDPVNEQDRHPLVVRITPKNKPDCSSAENEWLHREGTKLGLLGLFLALWWLPRSLSRVPAPPHHPFVCEAGLAGGGQKEPWEAEQGPAQRNAPAAAPARSESRLPAPAPPHLPQVDALGNPGQDVEPIGRSRQASHGPRAYDLLLELVLGAERTQRPFSAGWRTGGREKRDLVQPRRGGSLGSIWQLPAFEPCPQPAPAPLRFRDSAPKRRMMAEHSPYVQTPANGPALSQRTALCFAVPLRLVRQGKGQCPCTPLQAPSSDGRTASRGVGMQRCPTAGERQRLGGKHDQEITAKCS